jgi:hypothetical protein
MPRPRETLFLAGDPPSYLPLKVATEIGLEMRKHRSAGSGSRVNDKVVILLPTCPLVIVLRETDLHAALWELLLSDVARLLPTELAAVDASWTTNAS